MSRRIWRGRKAKPEVEMDDRTVRAALQRHWDASDANDFEAEHDIYHDDAVLYYPQSGERPSSPVGIMAFREGWDANETPSFAEPFDPAPSRAHLVERVG